MANTSTLSTPVSVNIPPSVIKEIERTQGKPEELRLPEPVGPFGLGELNSVSDAPTVIDLGDGDIELKVNNTIFRSHKHLLADFGRLKEMIKGMERYSTGAPCISIYRDERGVEDFKNMFKVLYATLVKGPFEFDTPILISSLRIATAYEYPELRKFSIDRLELAAESLSAVKRIQLAREFDLTAWDESAFQELATREGPITKEEAWELGFERFEELAKAREEEKRKKGAEDERVRRKEEERRKREEEEAQRVREEEEREKREEEKKRKREEEEKRQQEEEEKRKREEEEQKKREEERKKREEEEQRQREEEEQRKREEEEKRQQEEEQRKREEEEQKKREEEEQARKEAEKKEAEEKAKQEAEAHAAAAA